MIAWMVRRMQPGERWNNVPKATAGAMVREAQRIAKRERCQLLLSRKQTHHRSAACTVERIA